MDSTFISLIRHILSEEGGRSDHPEDQGGKTNFGITQGFLNHVLQDKDFNLDGATPLPEDVFALTQEQARQLYYYYFWFLPKINQLPLWHALGVMDFAVNSGPETAIKLLQASMRKIHPITTLVIDSRLGPKTLRAIESLDPLTLIEEYTAVRLNHIAKNPTYPTFGGGWNRRIARIESKCVQLAMLNGGTHHV